ncbi:serine-rich adhesin for platelets-like isoform X2 [Linepithema humile]|uniref:serine-rich adhesin for platelets-like isoform X2 n=1 Tax=Linepithema humile TaxID=83485 RepID=UPI00351EC71F
MPKRPIHLQPPDNSCRRIRRDLDFLRDYWNRLLAPNQNCDIYLPELLRANHLMRHLSALPSNHGMRVNMSFTILDNSACLESEDVYNETYPIEPYNSGLCRSPCSADTVRYNNFLRNYTTQLSENYAAIERELIRARLLASLIERDRLARCQNAFYNQRAAACNWNKFPVGSQTSSARMFTGLQEGHVSSRERSNRHQAHPSFQYKSCIPDRINNNCSINQQSTRQKENPERFNDLPKSAEQHWFQKLPQNSPQISCCWAAVKKLQSNNNAPQNRAETTLDRNDEATIKQRRSKESMEACQSVSKTINEAAKISHSVDSPDVKPADGGGVAINKSDKRSAQPISCQGNVLQFVESSNVATDQSRHTEEQGRRIKRKLNNLENQTIEIDQGTSSQQNGSKTSDRIKSYFKDVPTIFSFDEKAVRSRIRNGRMPIEGRSYLKRRVSSPRYASFLRMLRKEEADERLRGNSSSRRNEAEKLQRRGLSAESTGYSNRAIHDDPRIKKRTPTPRSTVHTTYNAITHSSAADPILDSSGLTIQLLRLAVLLYAPALMPALNSLIAQQNQQTPVSSAFERSNDLLTQIFRLLNEQQSIPNLPFVSIESERVSSALAAETDAGSSQTRSEENKENTSIAKEESGAAASQESISAGTSGWKSNNRLQQQNGKNRNWRLTSILTDSDVRLDRNIFTAEDFRKFEEFLKAEKQHSEDIFRSLSTRSKNEIVMKEYFRNWLHRLLQQFNAVSSNLPSNEKTEYPEGSSRATGESSLEKVEGQESTNRSTPNESSDSSKNDRNTEHEEGDSDDQRSFTSATSTSSSKSVQLKQNDATVAKKEEPRNENSQD